MQPLGGGIPPDPTGSPQFRRIAVIDGHDAPAADLDLTAAYTARFGAPKVGQRVSVLITQMTDGFKAIAQAYTTICVAAA